MAVVTIDAKAELAQIQAAIDAEQTTPDPQPAESPAPTPAPAPAPAPEPSTEEDEDDFAGKLKLTPEQHKAFTDIMNKRIGKKVRETREAEEFAEAQYAERQLAERRAAALERENAELKARVQPAAEIKVDPEDGKPTRDKYDSDQAYLDAHISWMAKREAQKIIAEQRAADAAAAAEARRAEIVTAAEARVAKAIELIPDFREKVLDRANDILIPTAIIGYLERSELMPELVYHLTEHPELVEKLAKMPPDEQLVTIGEIKSNLSPFGSSGSKANGGAKPSEKAVVPSESHDSSDDSAGVPPSRARSSAPVITPLNGNGAAGGPVDPAHMTIRQHIADYQKRNRANLGLRKRH